MSFPDDLHVYPLPIGEPYQWTEVNDQPLEASQRDVPLGYEGHFLAGLQQAFSGAVISKPWMGTYSQSFLSQPTGTAQYDTQMHPEPTIDVHSGHNHQYSPAYYTNVSHQNPTGDYGSFFDQPMSFNLPVTPFNNLPLSPSTQGDSSMAPAVLTTSSEQVLGASSLTPFAEASTTHRCQFDRNGSPCHTSIIAKRREAAEHLRVYHKVKRNSSWVTCLWDGCMQRIRADGLSRHIVNCHMKAKLRCPICFKMESSVSSLQRHRQRGCVIEFRKTGNWFKRSSCASKS
ncbi:hypothetical protein BV22DRAFT_885975 [Leucogyrophana mollusca]|uniref:Uncharacterized protein n=1 Tax=Leucogyrophana mollusca TaxID=85980 RepID=A0ACB8B0Q8_9AGAM|nr:hypothetical protein BV22DRAFT_885975 [Leucogyrophana mollusca]